MIPCYKCTRPMSIHTCSKCKQIYKYHLVRALLKLDKIYLSEHTRNKKGRPSTVITHKTKIRMILKDYSELKSYRKVAKKHNLTKHQVQQAILQHPPKQH